MMPCIEQFFREVHPNLPPGEDWYPSVFDSPLFYPLQRTGEMEKMIQVARAFKPQTIMEIGTDKGGGLYHWCQCLQPKRVIACEIRGCPYKYEFERAFPKVQFCWVERSSQPPLEMPWTRIDVLFIDGDKGAFVEDFDAYLPLMNKNGVVFMHDVQDNGPKKAFESIIARGLRHEIIIDKTDTRQAILRERQGLPPESPHEGWLRHWQGRSCGVGVIYLDS